MAIYYLGMRTFSRGAGKSGSRATSGAAYRAGERIRDERTSTVYDHRHRKDVLHKEIVLPAHAAAKGASFDWARNRSVLWNAAERAETRRNARVAREFTVALPHELTAAGRTALTQRFAQQIADRYGSAVDVAIHAPRGDSRNFHAHLFTTTREITAEGLGRKTALELSGTERHHLGMPRWRDEIATLGERWAALANDALQQEHSPARISHRSRAELAREVSGPPRLPVAAYHMEKRGERSFVAERIREEHRARLQSAREADVGVREVVAIAPTASSGPLGARSRLQRLGASVRAAWHGVRATVRDRGIPGQEATGRAPELPADPRGPPARGAPKRSRVLEIRQSWLTEAERAWRQILDRSHEEPSGSREPRQERQRSRDHGLEL